MENFVLYHEIYKKEGIIMYKGRKKGTIAYVAISCIDKDQRIKVTNHVRIVYDLDHKHVVKFYEWYETSNHLWLVTDLCVGGSLQQMLIEDINMPEMSVRVFGGHLIRGLQYLHSKGVICGTWHPSKIVLDGTGNLKYFDFSDSCKFKEDYDELVQRFFTGINSPDPRREIEDLFDFRRPTPYTAPEVLKGATPGFQSDIWGLGCILFEMFTGQVPFSGASGEEISHDILNNPILIPKVQGSRLTGRASSELSNLIEQMLHKNPDSRITMEMLWQHPFWQGSLIDLSLQIGPKTAFSEPLNQQQNLNRNYENSAVRPRTSSLPVSNEESDSSMSSNTIEEASFTLHLGSRITSEAINIQAVDCTTVSKRSKFQIKNGIMNTGVPGTGNAIDFGSNVEFLTSDEYQQVLDIAMTTTSSNNLKNGERNRQPIEDYGKLLKDGKLKYDVKLLQITPLPLTKLRGLRQSERQKHLKQMESMIKVCERGPPSQRRLQLINYLAQISMGTEISTYMVIDAVIHEELVRQAKTSSNQDFVVRACQAIAIMWHNCNLVKHNKTVILTSITEALVTIGDILRDQFRCTRVKLAALSCLGEGLTQLAISENNSQNDNDNEEDSSTLLNNIRTGEKLGFPSLMTLINRCLLRNEEVNTNLIASRIIETVSNYPGSSVARTIANGDTMQQIYSCYKHATLDQLKTSSIVAMCRLTRLDVTLFVSLIDKTGTGGLLENLHVTLTSVQEAVLEMFILGMIGGIQRSTQTLNALPLSIGSRKLCQESSSFLKYVMRLLETPSVLVRAKVLVLVLILCKSDLSLLKVASDHRLVLSLERELKRTTNTGGMQTADLECVTLSSRPHSDTMELCLSLFTNFLSSTAVPVVLEECSAALKAVQDRKHPSQTQTKALKTMLPLLECVANLVNSSLLRQRIITNSFCVLLGELLCHAGRFNNAQISPIGNGNNVSNVSGQEFMTHALSLIESACHNPDNTVILMIVQQLLEPLCVVSSSNGSGDVRIIALKLCSDIIGAIVQNDLLESAVVNVTSLSNCVQTTILCQMKLFINDPDPSAVYFLRLLRNYLHINPEQCVTAMKQQTFLPILAKLIVDHQQRIMSAALLESLLLISSIAVISADLIRDFILEFDLVPLLCDTLLEVGEIYHKDDVSIRTPKTCELFQVSIDSLYVVAKLISDVVRRALQSKKNYPDNEEMTIHITNEAEELLGAGKPLTEIVDLLIHSLGKLESDHEVVETSLRLLNQVVSLYGGHQIHHALNDINLQLLCSALTLNTVRQKRILLRILKRLLASGDLPSPLAAEVVRDTLSDLGIFQSGSEVDSVCCDLAEEILKCLIR